MRLPGPLLALLLAGLGGAACAPAGDAELEVSGEPGRLVRFEPLLRTIASCHGPERAAAALRGAAALRSWWAGTACEGPGPPEVDFERDIVLAVRGAEGSTGCYAVRIAEVRTGVGGGYRVIVHRHVPEASTPCPMIVVHPAHAVKVPRVRGPVDFEWRTVQGPPAAEGGG